MFSNILSATWFLFEIFIFIAYLMVMFHIIGDIFRDRELGGFGKALWIIGLIFLPIITALIYLIARGKGMAERQREMVQKVRSQQEEPVCPRPTRSRGPRRSWAKARSRRRSSRSSRRRRSRSRKVRPEAAQPPRLRTSGMLPSP
jgi:ABC-type multidrug transport system fused ATPase/permease subunit